jgi:hypothetical protein
MKVTKIKENPSQAGPTDNMPGTLKRVMIELEIPDVEKILRIDMDDDPAEALEFVKEVLAKQVKESLQPH